MLDRWGVSRETGKSCKVGRRPTQQYGNRLWLAVQKKKLAAAGPRAGTWFAMAVSEGKGWMDHKLPARFPPRFPLVSRPSALAPGRAGDPVEGLSSVNQVRCCVAGRTLSQGTCLLKVPYSTQQVLAVQERPRDMGSGPRASWSAGGRQPEDPWRCGTYRGCMALLHHPWPAVLAWLVEDPGLWIQMRGDRCTYIHS